MQRIMPKKRVISDTRKVVYYYRPSPDHTRVVFGGRVALGESDPQGERAASPQRHVRPLPGTQGKRRDLAQLDGIRRLHLR